MPLLTTGTKRGCRKARETRRSRAAGTAWRGRECALASPWPLPALSRERPLPSRPGGVLSQYQESGLIAALQLGLLKQESQSDVPSGGSLGLYPRARVLSLAKVGGRAGSRGQSQPTEQVKVPPALAYLGTKVYYPEPSKPQASTSVFRGSRPGPRITEG